MKKLLFILFIAVFTCQVVTAQNYAKIDVELQQEMSLRNADELIPINIIMNQQYDQMEMRSKAGIYFKKEEKRNFVVNELKSFSKETQKDLLFFLDVLEENQQITDVKSYWIANFIGCFADIAAIEALSSFPDVMLIGFEQEHQCIPVDEVPGESTEGTREIVYGVLKVNANKVWDELGFTGEDVIVAINDTGVNYNHNDLKTHMWEHPDFPYHGYNVNGNNNNPMDGHGHGTHCAGTVAGNGTAGSQTGMAPNAKIMAIKVWNDSGSGTTAQMISGFQFAVEHGAHVISMSGGVHGGGSTSERIQFRNSMNNVLEAGVVASIAAGNEHTGYTYVAIPNQVRVPGSCPPPWLHTDQTTTGGTSAVVCVGATDQNDNIANFSSWGPVTWQGISGFDDYPYNPGMGLIRPDVSAPGVSIKSCDYSNINGYQSMSGTSMACPCVSGVMALMLSKNINLTPAEICEILQTTAVPLPNASSPKNNTYGAGRIDAFAAVSTIAVIQAPQEFMANPLSSSQIELQWQKNINNDPVIVFANTVTEFGKPQKGNSYQIGDVLADGGEVIYFGDEVSFIHTNLSQGTPYFYKLFAYNENYEYSKEIDAQACTRNQYPLFEGFEDENALFCWEQEQIENEIFWVYGKGNNDNNPPNPYEGENNLIFKWNGNQSEIGSTTRLFLPPMEMNDFDNVKLSFALYNEGTNNISDQLSIYYKTAESEDWTLWKSYSKSLDIWTLDTLVLPENVETQSLQICFQGKLKGGYGICIDNLYVEGFNTISVDDYFLADKITVYPNPTTGKLRVTSYELQVTGIELVDIYGRIQKAESRKQKAEGEIEIDITNLAVGVYFVKIYTEAGVVTKKVIKN